MVPFSGSIGFDNALKIRVFGEKGTLEFVQEENNYLKVSLRGQPPMVYSRGAAYLTPEAQKYVRVPCGHPEGLTEAFANIYRDFCAALRDRRSGKKVVEESYGYPTIDPALSGRGACVADLGTHIENWVSYVTGLSISSLCCNLDVFGTGGVLDNNVEVLVKYDGGASGMYWTSQVAIDHRTRRRPDRAPFCDIGKYCCGHKNLHRNVCKNGCKGNPSAWRNVRRFLCLAIL